MFRLKKVCCCIPLRPGGVVLGVVSLLSALLTVAITSLGIVNKHKPMRWDNGTALFDEDSVNKAQPVLWALTVLYVIVAIVAGLMIKGSIERRRKLLVPYMVLDLLGAVLFSIAVIAAMIVSEAKGETKAAVAFIGIAVVGIQLYFWLCAYSLYRLFKEEETALPGIEPTQS